MMQRNKLKKRGKNMSEKVHHKQKEFYDDKSRNRWIFGGNRTGKTHAGAQEAINYALKSKCEGWVVSLSTQVQRDVAQRKVLELINKEQIKFVVMLKGRSDFPENGVIDFIELHNGSRIGFKNCEQGREKFQGTALNWVWFDEEPSEDIYDECMMRLLDHGGDIWGTMTPLKGRTWVYERVFMNANSKSDIKVFNWAWSDNPFLHENEIAFMEQNYSSETLEMRKYGRFIEGTGMVFKEFTDENIKIVGSEMLTFENVWYTGLSIDPGYTGATAVLWFRVLMDGRIFVIDEYKDSNRSIEEISKFIIERSRENGTELKHVFIDSAAMALSLGSPESVVEQFRKFGIPVDPSVDKSVIEGIHKVKSLFCSADGTRRLFITDNCEKTIREIRGYFWSDKNNDKPKKVNDHCVDALRYFCMADHRDLMPVPVEVDPFKKHKRRTMNENR